jgi:hypothetical protein
LLRNTGNQLPVPPASKKIPLKASNNKLMKYWLEETAEAMLLLRSFYKSGRWDMLNKHAHSIPYDALP